MSQDPIHLETRNADGPKRFSSSAARNHAVIAARLSTVLPPRARVLEIASGTGEHGFHACAARPDIIWQPSDPDVESRNSQNAWAADTKGQMLPSLSIDTTQPDWFEILPRYDAIFCANMIHIAPWEAAIGLVDGAQKLVSKNGVIVLYGPFKEGAHTAQSNLDFDASLKSRNPSWGVRDLASVKHIFAKAGFNTVARTAMPKNNLILEFSRSV